MLSVQDEELAKGTGTTKEFVGLTLVKTNVKPRSVTITAQHTPNLLTLTDDQEGNPTPDGKGNLTGDGDGTIDYATGSISIEFDEAVDDGEPVEADYAWFSIPSTVEIKYSDCDPDEVSTDLGCALTTGTGNKDADPLFANAASGDYHLQSKWGRWDPGTEDWVYTDTEFSPCLDWGDHSMPVNEPDPNGFHVNMGAYGNTDEASMSKNWPIEADATGDCRVNILDLMAITAHIGQSPDSGDNWKYNVNGDGLINMLDLIYVRSRLNTQCP